MDEELIVSIREKGQYETYTAYLDYIKSAIEKQNNNVMKAVMNKDSEIAELKSQISSLEAKNANIEKDQSESSLSETESSLKSCIEELNSVITDLKEIREDNLSNNKGQYDVVKQEEIEDILKDILAEVLCNRKEIIERIVSRGGFIPAEDYHDNNNVENNETPKPINMEDAFSATTNQEIEPDKDFGKGRSLVEQVSGFEKNNENNNSINEQTIVPQNIESIIPQESHINDESNNTVEDNNNNIEEIQENTEDKVESNESVQPVNALNAANIKAVRASLNYLHDKKDDKQPFTTNSMLLRNAEASEEYQEYFANTLTHNQEQSMGRSR